MEEGLVNTYTTRFYAVRLFQPFEPTLSFDPEAVEAVEAVEGVDGVCFILFGFGGKCSSSILALNS